jgi:hypothetical protein
VATALPISNAGHESVCVRVIVKKGTIMLTSILRTVAISCLLIGSTAAFAEDPPNLVGNWNVTAYEGVAVGASSHRQVDDPDKPRFYSASAATYEIVEQNGRKLVGKRVSRREEEQLLGIITFDNSAFYLADDDQIFIGKILSADELQLCGVKNGATAIGANCALLERQQ